MLISREVQSPPPDMPTQSARWSWEALMAHYRDLVQIYMRTLNGYIVNTSRVTGSPYDILETDDDIFVNTDGGDVTVNLPEGVTGKKYRVINTGSSGNLVELVPNGTEELIGINSSITIDDTEAVIVTFEPTEGWY